MPHFIRAADARDGGERIDRARIRRARRGDDKEGLEFRCAIGVNCRLELIDPHAKSFIDRNDTHTVAEAPPQRFE